MADPLPFPQRIPLSPLVDHVRGAEEAPVTSACGMSLCSFAELQLIELWQELLHVEGVGVNDNFFTLGGHSLLAVRMLARVEQLFGKSIPVATLLADPTIGALTAYLGADAPEESGVYTLFNERGTKQPLVFFHGALHGGFHCRALARVLGDDQPMYAIAPHGADRRALPPTIQEMAGEYVELVRQLVPGGSYRLAGYCNGGLLAFEIARRLAQRGERVERLIVVAGAANGALRPVEPLIDALARLMNLSDRRRRTLRRAYLRCNIFVRELVVADAASRRRIAREFLAATLHRVGLMHPAASTAPSEALLHGDVLSKQYGKIVGGYVPGRYGGEMTLILPDEPPKTGPRVGRNLAADWRKMTGASVNTRWVSGNLVTMITRHIDQIGRQITATLEGSA